MQRKTVPNHTPAKSIRQLLTEVDAAPAAELHQPPGFDHPTRITPVTPAVVGEIDLAGEMLPAASAAAAQGFFFSPLSLDEPGRVLRMSEAIMRLSRVCRAGGQMVFANTAPVSAPSTANGPVFYTRPTVAKILKPAPFTPLADGAQVAVSAWPTVTDTVTVKDAATHSVHLKISRRDQKSMPDELLAYEIGYAVVHGLANLFDQVVLAAILAKNPAAFSFGAMAAHNVSAQDLRAIVGTNGTGFVMRADGTPALSNGLPAELSPSMAQTIAGDFGTAFGFVADHTRLVLKRTAVDGELDVVCHVSVKPSVPDVGYFGVVGA